MGDRIAPSPQNGGHRDGRGKPKKSKAPHRRKDTGAAANGGLRKDAADTNGNSPPQIFW